MYYILIDPAVSLMDITKVPNTLVSLIDSDYPRIILRYRGIPFVTNVPIEDNVKITGNTCGMLNGDVKEISLYVDSSLHWAVDMFMTDLFNNKIMSTVMKMDNNFML